MPSNVHLLPELAADRVSSRCVCCGGANIRSSPAVLMPFVAHRALGWEPVRIDESWGLKTLEKGFAYSVCRSLHCLRCGLLFLDIRFSENEMRNLYRDYRGVEYTALREFYEPGYQVRNEFLMQGNDYIGKIEDFLFPYVSHPITILDWGGDTGRNTPFRGLAEIFHVYDISGKEAPVGGQSVSLEEAIYGKYSLVVCSNVLEHVPSPIAVLSDIVKIMGRRTILYVEVPLENIMRDSATNLPHAKRHWHEHINFFSEKSLIMLAEKVGLDILELRVLEAVTGGNFSSVFQVACKVRNG